MNGCPIHGVTGPTCTPECRDYARDLRRSHQCHEHAVEVNHDGPRPNGEITIVTRCDVCGRTLSHGTDRVLWAH